MNIPPPWNRPFEEHQADARRRAEQQVELESETDRTRDEQKLSLEQIGIKRELGHKQEELKDKIFVELADVLEQYMETPDYQRLLDSQIRHARGICRK